MLSGPQRNRDVAIGAEGDFSQANSRMAGGSPQHHLGWLGYRLGDCSGAPLLAPHFEVINLLGDELRWGDK